MKRYVYLAVLSLGCWVYGACTEITTYFPVCINAEINRQDGTVRYDTLAVPDSACLAQFKAWRP